MLVLVDELPVGFELPAEMGMLRVAQVLAGS